MIPTPGSVVTSAPWNDQDIVRGSSPTGTMHETWAKEPSFMMEAPNVMGSISGLTKIKTKHFVFLISNPIRNIIFD